MNVLESDTPIGSALALEWSGRGRTEIADALDALLGDLGVYYTPDPVHEGVVVHVPTPKEVFSRGTE